VAATLPPTDKQPIKNYAERNGDAEVDPLSTVDFEEKEVYGHSVPVLQNERREDQLFSGFLTDGSRGRPSKRSPMMLR